MRRRAFLILFALAVVLSLTSGCSGLPDGKKLLSNAAAKADKPAFTKTDCVFDMTVSTYGLSVDIAGNISASISKGIVLLSLELDFPALMYALSMDELKQDAYIQSSEGAVYIYLKGGDGVWRKAVIDSEYGDIIDFALSSQETSSLSTFASIIAISDSITTKEKVNYAGVDCYKVEAVIDGDKYGAFSSMISGAVPTAAPATDLPDLTVYYYIGAGDGLYYGMTLDISNYISQYISASLESADVAYSKCELYFAQTSAYTGSPVSLPDGAAAAAEDTFENVISSSWIYQLLQSYQTGSEL